MKFPRRTFYLLIAALLSGTARQVFAQGESLNRKLKPKDQDMEEQLYDDMVVIQKKAMNKEGRFLISTYGGFDFSDGPYTMYSLNINPGYAISDFWEVYLAAAPLYFSQQRDIVRKVEDKGLSITMAKPRYSYGLELLWSPLYGKDSLGSRKIIRSDTFVKFGVHNIQYDQGGSGLKLHLGLGKTYFLTKNLGLRPAVSGNYIQTIVDNEKKFRFVAIVELGLVTYF